MSTLGLVVAAFNRHVTERMEGAAKDAIAEHDVTLAETVHVPGAYDAPLAADRLADRSAIEAVAVVGAIITGDTAHDRVIGHALAQRLTEISLQRDTPVTLGVTGPGMSADEAEARIDNAQTAVESAINLVESLPDRET